jgi:hypothetical protein
VIDSLVSRHSGRTEITPSVTDQLVTYWSQGALSARPSLRREPTAACPAFGATAVTARADRRLARTAAPRRHLPSASRRCRVRPWSVARAQARSASGVLKTGWETTATKSTPPRYPCASRLASRSLGTLRRSCGGSLRAPFSAIQVDSPVALDRWPVALIAGNQ